MWGCFQHSTITWHIDKYCYMYIHKSKNIFIAMLEGLYGLISGYYTSRQEMMAYNNNNMHNLIIKGCIGRGVNPPYVFLLWGHVC